MTFRRGFKTESERLASEVRLELGLTLTNALDPFALAEHLAIPIIAMRDVAAFVRDPTIGLYFSRTDDGCFSALTIFDGYRRIIVHNETHAATRQRSNVAHELAHTILEHPSGPATASGNRCWDGLLEREADWLGGALLVPREGALQLFRAGLSVFEIAENFGVSEELAGWRVNGTGIPLHSTRLARFSRVTHSPRYSRKVS